MTEIEPLDEEEISLFAVGTTLVRNWRRILLTALAGGLIAVLPVLRQPLTYVSRASFIPNGASSGNQSGVAGLAGQLGVSMPSGPASQSPDFYMSLLKSRELLGPITRDTFAVAELNGKLLPFSKIFDLQGDSVTREEQGVALLSHMIETSVVRTTGIVELSVGTVWPSLSREITAALIEGVNDFNQRTRQGQAAAERKFIDSRLALARTDLRAAEDRLAAFLETNKQLFGSPSLQAEHDRLQRDISLRQQVFTSLMQSYEDARIREVRDTPLITVIDAASLPTRPAPRGRTKRGVLGLLFGLIVGVIWAFLVDSWVRRRAAGDPDAAEFFGSVDDAKKQMLSGWRQIRDRRRGPSPQ